MSEQERDPRRIRQDVFLITAAAVLAAVSVVSLATSRLQRLFTADGIAWTLPVEPAAASANGLRLYTPEGPEPTAAITGTMTQLEVTVPDVNAVSAVCLGASVVIVALTALTVISCTARIGWLFRSGRFFTAPTSRALTTLTYVGTLGFVVAYGLWKLGANGVEAAVGARVDAMDGPTWWGWYLIALFAAFSFGLVDMALRRAIRLERDTEGLV